MENRLKSKGTFFDELANKKKELKISIIANIMQFAFLVLAVLLIAMASQTKVLSITIPPGDYSGQTFKVGLNDASDQTYELWAEVLAQKGGSYSPKNVEDKVKWMLQFAVPDRYFIMKTDFDKLIKDVKDNFITSKFNFKTAKIMRKTGYVTVSVFGTMDRWVGTDHIMKEIPYIYEIDMVVKNGNVLFGRFAGHIDKTPPVAGVSRGKAYEKSSKYINFK